MIVYVRFGGVKEFLQSASNPLPLQLLTIGQDVLMPLTVVVVADSQGNNVDANWTIEVAVQGGTGNETGTEGDAVYAAYTGAGGFAYTDTDGVKSFTSSLDTRDPKMALLIGPAKNHGTTFAVKASKIVAGTLVQSFHQKILCDVEAPVIESGITANAGGGPIAFTVLAGQNQSVFVFPNLPDGADLVFSKRAGNDGPGVKGYVITVNDDNPALTTVTATLDGIGIAGGSKFLATVLRS